MKKAAGIGFWICSLVLLPTLVFAARGDNAGPVDVQGFAWTTDATSTSSTKWVSVRGLRDVSAACPGRGGASATVSLELVEGPARLRVRMNEIGGAVPIGEEPPGRLMRPGAVTVDAGDRGAGAQSHSYTFVAGRIPGDQGANFDVQWRSPTGSPIALRKATLRALWNKTTGACA